jgi:2-methylisocitrate lyase-like PEP mutase family enzyme
MKNKNIIKLLSLMSLFVLTIYINDLHAMIDENEIEKQRVKTSEKPNQLERDKMSSDNSQKIKKPKKNSTKLTESNQIEKAKTLHTLHIKGTPLILYNIWSAGSAKEVQKAGALAIGTSSWSIAEDHGYEDGEKIPLKLVLKNLERITKNIITPITFDMEGGYTSDLIELMKNTKQIIKAGAVGVNFEDQIVGGDGLYSIPIQIERIKAVRKAAEECEVPLFINARSDVFFKTGSITNPRELLEEALKRAHAYAEAGANGFFVPGLQDLDLIKELCQKCELPVNIMLLSNTPSPKELSSVGVARISYGPFPYIKLMKLFQENALSSIIHTDK